MYFIINIMIILRKKPKKQQKVAPNASITAIKKIKLFIGTPKKNLNFTIIFYLFPAAAPDIPNFDPQTVPNKLQVEPKK